VHLECSSSRSCGHLWLDEVNHCTSHELVPLAQLSESFPGCSELIALQHTSQPDSSAFVQVANTKLTGQSSMLGDGIADAHQRTDNISQSANPPTRLNLAAATAPKFLLLDFRCVVHLHCVHTWRDDNAFASQQV